MRSKRIDKILGLKFARFKRNGKIGNNTKMNIIREKHKKPPAFGTKFGTKIRRIKGFKSKNFALTVTKCVK